MNGLNPGDTLAIQPGSYNDGIFSHLTGITIINHGGLVVFTGTVYVANNSSVNFVGTGAGGLTYGFKFNVGSNNIGCFVLDGHIENSTWSNIEFINCGSDAFGNQNYQTVYDGVNDNTKRLFNCKISNIHMDGCGAFMANFRGQFTNVIDKCDFGYVIINNSNTVQIMDVVAFYRSNIHHWTIGQQRCGPPHDAQGHTLDQGCFEIYGSPDIYDCTEMGQNYGWFMRITQQGLMGRQDSHVYNNIRVGSTNYGFIDYRQDVTGYTLTTPPYCRGGDMYIVNNTMGNMVTTNNYLTPVVVAYNFAGQHLYVNNNLRFNSINKNNTPDSANVVHYGSSADFLIESNNKYYANAIASGVLADTTNCFLKAGSPAVDAGINQSFISTDFAGISRPQGAAFDVGAREYDQNTPPNQPPVAVTGLKQTITLPTNTASLDGSKSYDPDGSITAYSWSVVSGPGATITNATSASTVVTGLTQGTYIFKLQVTDNGNATGSALDTVIVNPSNNQPPVANAGSSSTITLPLDSVKLDGSLSADPDNNIQSYSWTEISGPSTAVFLNGNNSIAEATSLIAGNYIFQLTVKDSLGASSTSQVKVKVVAAVVVGLQPPVANAGADQTITLPTSSVTLNGSASVAAAGGIISYAWVESSGPSTATIGTPGNVTTSVSGLQQGSYIFKLTIKDSAGAFDSDSITVKVNPAPNKPPVANAGADQTITLPTNTVQLDGSLSSDPDGTIVSYSWNKISGPGAISISNSTTVNATASNLQKGTYVFELTVTDNSGAIATNQMIVTVNPAPTAPNQLPIANAGNNLTITLPQNSISLNGTNSFDPDGSITAYSWTEISGPSTASLSASTSSVATASGLLAGSYVFQLTVTDNSGAIAKDLVTVTVNAAVPKADAAPVAVAGTDTTIILPVSSLMLDGNGSWDADGSITSYEWQEMSGPNSASLSSFNNATSMVTGLEAGNYEFMLTVRDALGASSTASVKVTVVKGVESVEQLVLYPNPAHDIVNVRLTSTTVGTVEAAVYDISGKMVYKEELNKDAGYIEKQFNVSSLAKGTYIMHIVIGNKTTMFSKFIKQ